MDIISHKSHKITMTVDIIEHNRKAWNKTVTEGKSPWVQPVDAAAIAAAREGDWTVVLTPILPVPRDWFGEIKGKRVLGLASGGGQQMPLFAAAGARVTSFDNSDEMLACDRAVAEREGLEITCEQGDMADLSRFADDAFDFIFHPVSNVFVPDVLPVWREAYRVLAPGGRLLAGFMNPAIFIFDWEKAENKGKLKIKYEQLYADPTSLSKKKLAARIKSGEAMEFGHSMDAQIGGQLKAGFRIEGFYEDHWGGKYPTDPYMPCTFATLAVKG
jgi:SAM-dependent methyltransferase